MTIVPNKRFDTRLTNWRKILTKWQAAGGDPANNLNFREPLRRVHVKVLKAIGQRGPFNVQTVRRLEALMLLTIKPSSPIFINPVDPVVSSWASRVASRGPAPSLNTVLAIDRFWKGLQADNLASAIFCLNVMAPDSRAAAITPLVIGPAARDPWGTNILDSDVSINGITGPGSVRFMNSGLNLSVFPNNQTVCQFVYDYNAISANQDASGAVNSSTNFGLQLAPNLNGTSYSRMDGATFASSGTKGSGFYLGSRVSSTDNRLYFANSTNPWAQQGATEVTLWNGVWDPFDLYVLTLNYGGNAAFFSTDTLSCAGWCNVGLTSSQGQQLYNRLQRLRQDFGGGFR